MNNIYRLYYVDISKCCFEVAMIYSILNFALKCNKTLKISL